MVRASLTGPPHWKKSAVEHRGIVSKIKGLLIGLKLCFCKEMIWPLSYTSYSTVWNSGWSRLTTSRGGGGVIQSNLEYELSCRLTSKLSKSVCSKSLFSRPLHAGFWRRAFVFTLLPSLIVSLTKRNFAQPILFYFQDVKHPTAQSHALHEHTLEVFATGVSFVAIQRLCFEN